MLNYLLVDIDINKAKEVINWRNSNGNSYQYQTEMHYSEILRQDRIPAQYLLYQNNCNNIVCINLVQQTRSCYVNAQDFISQLKQLRFSCVGRH